MATTERRIAFQGGQLAPEKVRGLESHLSWEIGLLKSINRRDALGLTLEVGTSFDPLRQAVHVRGRRFLGERSSVEVGVGLARTDVGSLVGEEARGLVLTARYNLEDKLSVLVGYDNFEWPDPRAATFTYLDPADRAQAFKMGVASGSWPGLITTGVVAIGFTVLALLLAGSS